MRVFSQEEARHRLRNGLIFCVPLREKPSAEAPCKAIAEAAGIPGISEGHGRLTRKRFIKLVMSTGNSRTDAEYLAFAAHRHGVSYRDCLRRTMIPLIMKADSGMKELFSGAVLARAELVKDEIIQEEDTYVMPVPDKPASDAEV